MTVESIRLFPEPVLSTPCQKITSFDDQLYNLAKNLEETLYHSPGVGLAAPQIGVSLQIAVIDVGRKQTKKTAEPNHGFLTIINPVILTGEGTQIPREGCLSVPDLLANVNRFQKVHIQYQDLLGAKQEIIVEGFEALAFQHEIDHLNGLLFLDRVTNIKTDIFRRKKDRQKHT
ncbi:MAG: peptide deformylase [Elusimicrobiota bacterium]